MCTCWFWSLNKHANTCVCSTGESTKKECQANQTNQWSHFLPFHSVLNIKYKLISYCFREYYTGRYTHWISRSLSSFRILGFLFFSVQIKCARDGWQRSKWPKGCSSFVSQVRNQSFKIEVGGPFVTNKDNHGSLRPLLLRARSASETSTIHKHTCIRTCLL